jgi:hypothetical protein
MTVDTDLIGSVRVESTVGTQQWNVARNIPSLLPLEVDARALL